MWHFYRLNHRLNFGIVLKLTLVVALALTWLASGAALPTYALDVHSPSFDPFPGANVLGSTCEQDEIGVSASIYGQYSDIQSSGESVDLGLLVAIDGNGTILTSSEVLVSSPDDVNSHIVRSVRLTGITARPVTIELVDIVTFPTSLAGLPVRGSFTIDPQVLGNCRSLPYVSHGTHSSIQIQKVTHTTCTPGDQPRFDWVEVVAARDNRYTSVTLTNERTGAVSGPVQDAVITGPAGPIQNRDRGFGSASTPLVVPPGTQPGDTLILHGFFYNTPQPALQKFNWEFQCLGYASTFEVTRVTFAACRPGQAPRFDYTQLVAPDDSRHLSASLTSAATGSVSRLEDPDSYDWSGPEPGRGYYITDSVIADSTINGIVNRLYLYTPAYVAANDTLTLNVAWKSDVGLPIIHSTISYNCGHGYLLTSGIVSPIPRNQLSAEGCFQQVSIFVPKGPDGPAHFETQQQPANCQPINQDANANVALYCQNGDLSVYAINNATGYFAFGLSKDDLAGYPADPKKNFLIKEALGARLYRLTNGNLQINRATSDPNRDYVFIWGGC